MKIMIVRHGDPDYEKDSLTEIGWEEARLAAKLLSRQEVDSFYVSPLGRAKATAKCTLDLMGREGITCEWLKEFSPLIKRPDKSGEDSIAWDWLPEDWTTYPEFFHVDTWLENEIVKESNVPDEYAHVCECLDELLASHGYVRNGKTYRVENENHKCIVLFCHFGLECVLLSHLLNISPMLLWHGFCAAPSSITTLYTEERREGIAYFRAASFGDISHLYAGNRKPSFAARFCECFRDEARHD